MSNGLRYETGRDMPPGMAEKVAVQIAKRMATAAPPAPPETLPVAGCEVANERRLIDANAVCERCRIKNDGCGCCIIRATPAVDAVEVVHGYNTYDHDTAFECSVCGFSDWDTLTADDGKYNYCPNCGAKMDGERREGE